MCRRAHFSVIIVNFLLKKTFFVQINPDRLNISHLGLNFKILARQLFKNIPKCCCTMCGILNRSDFLFDSPTCNMHNNMHIS